MSLPATSSNSPRVRKHLPVASLKRYRSSPYANLSRTKAIHRPKSVPEDGYDGEFHGQDAAGENAVSRDSAFFAVASAKDVISALDHATRSMFCVIPERAGMNSMRIAQLLNFQKHLPPVVSPAHVHALVSSSSKVEREIASLLATGKIRRIRLTGRGSDTSGLSELLVTNELLNKSLNSSGLPTDVVDIFLEVLKKIPRATSVPSRSLSPAHLTALAKAGYLVSSSLSRDNVSLSGSSLVAMPSISRAASGSVAAVGGEAAFEQLGGVGSARRISELSTSNDVHDMHFSLPNIGSYIRLLKAGRAHLLELLGKSPNHEAPLYLLKERWDGAVDSDARSSVAKRIRGDFSGIMPAKTKKWKDLSGLNFDWILEECLGAGLVETFDTHSVGLAVRTLR
jgi:hypothetical protein